MWTTWPRYGRRAALRARPGLGRDRGALAAPDGIPCTCARTAPYPGRGRAPPARLTHIKLNLEMAATDEMVGIAARIKPEMAMLVPEGRHEVTTEGGLDVSPVRPDCARWSQPPMPAHRVGLHRRRGAQVEAAKRIGASVCEVHTGPYAHAFHSKGRDAESPAVMVELEKSKRGG